MTTTTISRTIRAPREVVFQTVAGIDQFSKAIPHITRVEMLSDITSGVGTRFRETREVKGRETSTELEVTEYAENDRVRLVADSHGTVWDSIFTVQATGEGSTELTLTMEARPKTLWSKLLNPLMKGMVRKALEADMDAVKQYCEAQSPPGVSQGPPGTREEG